MVNHRHLFLVIFLFFTGCVETLISVSVFPDARYLMKIESQGDKRDIYDKDFVLPTSDRWNIIEDQRLDSDSESPIFLRSAESLLMGENLLGENGKFGSLRYPVSVEKKESFFSDTYVLTQIFDGRGVDGKYPMLSKVLYNPGNKKSESIAQIEVVMYSLRKAMEDIGAELNVKALIRERILNHFNGVFFKAEEDKKLFEILNDDGLEKVEPLTLPEELIRTNFRPFTDSLPKNFVDKSIVRMRKYLSEANVTIQLNDDTFKFVAMLPGVIFRSNADSISNDSLWWKFDLKDFMNEPYTIEAASIVYYPQKIQQAVVLGALIILIVLFLINKRKAKY